MKKIIYVVLILLFLLLGIFLFSNYSKGTKNSDNSILGVAINTDNIQSLTLEVVSTDNIKTIYGATFKYGQTLVEILDDQANNKADFAYETEKSDFGDYIISINNEKANSASEFWNIKINGSDSQLGISDIVPQNNDVITFTLLKF